MSVATLFREVDRATFVAALAERLRDAGVAVGLSSENRCADALAACPPSDPSTVYWVTRTSLVHDKCDFAAFDAVFASVFDNEGLPIAPWERGNPSVPAKMTGTVTRYSAPTDGFALASKRMKAAQHPEVLRQLEDDGEEVDTLLPELLPTDLSPLADTPFDELSPADLEKVGRWIEEALIHRPKRRGRRYQRVPTRGRIDLRRTMAQARSTSAEPIRLLHRRTKPRPRRIVMVVDLSGSMESFARPYLHLMRALVAQGQAEVFCFTTKLRRVTVPLRERDTEAAMQRLGDEIEDRFGGTRIAGSLAQLVGSPVWSQCVRGAIVLIASDGWDTDEADDLTRQMLRLRRLAHRIIWINPRAANEDFAPTVGGMVAALPHVDRLLSGHSLSALHEVVDALGSDRPRRKPRDLRPQLP